MDDDPGDPFEPLELPVLAVVCDADRGSLPFALLQGEALVACAAFALGEAGVRQVDSGTSWAGLADSGDAVALHDPLCPLAPPDHLLACCQRSLDEQAVVVAVRPVTDTVKQTDDDGAVGETWDRDGLWQVVSPVVLPPQVVAAVAGRTDELGLAAEPAATDFPTLVTALARRWPVVTVTAPALARRVGDVEDVRVLESMAAAED